MCVCVIISGCLLTEFQYFPFSQALLIDMEEGVVNEILQGPLRDVFDSKQLITDVSGSGNNW